MRMQGKIIKGIAGFYYVHTETGGVYECRAKGIFRNRRVKPLVGDDVTVEILSEADHTGNITDILARRNVLIRPAAANVDQALLIFAVANPAPNYHLLDRFLVMMDYQKVPTLLCFNKTDLTTPDETAQQLHIYAGSGCQILFTSVQEQQGLAQLRALLDGKTTVLAGPSGVGKSSLMNLLLPDAGMETGDVSRIGRGRHTTRHSEIFHLYGSTYLCDTPGFTSLVLPPVEKEELRFYFNEFGAYEGRCRFHGCLHVNEPECAVKAAVACGQINEHRYQSYLDLYLELKAQKKY